MFSEARKLEGLMQWRALTPALAWSEFEVNAGTLRFPVRVVLVRMDPKQLDVALRMVTRSNGMTGAWNVDSVADDVVLAMNAGQFKETGPWGWLVMDGYEKRAPGFGPLSAGLAFDTSGAVRWLLPQQLATARRDRSIRFAFQSYPLLIFNDTVPPLLLSSGDMSRTHRDARLLLGEQRDGKLIIALTRYDALAGAVERVPIGLTVPEALVLAGELGLRRAVMLDGGISAQLYLRDAAGQTLVWRGLRNVPLGLVAKPKSR